MQFNYLLQINDLKSYKINNLGIKRNWKFDFNCFV